MPAKRKTDTVAEPSPPPKKRSSKSSSTSTTADKKRSRDDSAEGSGKGRRKKKLEEVEEEEGEEEREPTTPVAVTPKEKKTPKQIATTPKSVQKVIAPPSPPVTAMKSASKPRSSRKSIVRIDLPPEPASAKKSVSADSSNNAATNKRTRTPLRSPTTPLSMEKVAAVDPATDDEKEIVSLWEQTWGALHMSLIMIGPPFLFIVLACYFMGMLRQSQAIASVGVVYAFLFLTVMGSYAVVILPCILLARLFTVLVSAHAPERSAAEVNLYSRLLILFVAAAGMAYHYLRSHA